MYLISASPHTKIFLPEWEERILEDPNVIANREVPFHFNVPFPTGAVGMFEFGEVIRLDDLPCVKRRLPEDRLGLYNFLTGGASGMEHLETSLWGIVAVKFDTDMTKYTVEQMALETEAIKAKDEKKLASIEKKQKEHKAKFREQYREAQKKAEIIANDKVFNFIKFTAENMKDQWEKLKQDGKNPYKASVSELGCLWSLREYLQNKSNKRAQLTREAQEFIEKINSI